MQISELRNLRPEHELLLALARPRLTVAQQQGIREFLTERSEEIDWGDFIDQACRHMVMPIVGRHMSRLRLTHTDQGRPVVPYRWIYSDVYDSSRRRNLALADEYARVLRALNRAGIAYLIRKGPVLGEYVYQDPALRRTTNLDVFLRRTDLPVFEEVAAGLGFAMGRLSANGSSVVPFDRRTELYWKVNLTNTYLPYMRVGDRDLVEMYILSGCSSLFQPRLGIRDDAEELIERSVAVTLYGEPSRMLHPVDQIVDHCVQVHVRATMLYYIESAKDLTIRNFLDLVQVLGKAPEDFFDEFRARVEKYGCGNSVYYSLYFARQLYPDLVPAELVDHFRPADLTYLDEYGGFDGGRFTWSQCFAERLFDPQRPTQVQARSKVPGPRSVV